MPPERVEGEATVITDEARAAAGLWRPAAEPHSAGFEGAALGSGLRHIQLRNPAETLTSVIPWGGAGGLAPQQLLRHSSFDLEPKRTTRSLRHWALREYIMISFLRTPADATCGLCRLWRTLGPLEFGVFLFL